MYPTFPAKHLESRLFYFGFYFSRIETIPICALVSLKSRLFMLIFIFYFFWDQDHFYLRFLESRPFYLRFFGIKTLFVCVFLESRPVLFAFFWKKTIFCAYLFIYFFLLSVAFSQIRTTKCNSKQTYHPITTYNQII